MVVTCCANAHAETVSELVQEAWQSAGLENSGEFSWERVIRDMPQRLSYVAILQHKVVGVVILTQGDSGISCIEALCVAPEFHGQGIGELLIETAEKRAGELGAKRMSISGRLANSGFFRRYGYQAAAGQALLEKALA
ncbi:MAG: Acetyltransferase domain [Paenibacillaceae bacterium]|nr:Acetyltransferase domain [Paenibacillaceae bacterium]